MFGNQMCPHCGEPIWENTLGPHICFDQFTYYHRTDRYGSFGYRMVFVAVGDELPIETKHRIENAVFNLDAGDNEYREAIDYLDEVIDGKSPIALGSGLNPVEALQKCVEEIRKINKAKGNRR